MKEHFVWPPTEKAPPAPKFYCISKKIPPFVPRVNLLVLIYSRIYLKAKT